MPDRYKCACSCAPRIATPLRRFTTANPLPAGMPGGSACCGTSGLGGDWFAAASAKPNDIIRFLGDPGATEPQLTMRRVPWLLLLTLLLAGGGWFWLRPGPSSGYANFPPTDRKSTRLNSSHT